MFSNFAVGFFAGVGFGAWVYSKIYRSSGGNNRSSFLVAGLSGAGVWVLVWTILGIVLK